MLCWRENRYVGKQLTFSYERKRIMLEENELSRALVGQYVDTYAFVDGRFEVRWKGQSLPYRIFDMDQRVTHAAVTENKRLSAVLAHVKEMQEKAPPKPKVRTNSEKMGYKRLQFLVRHGVLRLSKIDPTRLFSPSIFGVYGLPSLAHGAL